MRTCVCVCVCAHMCMRGCMCIQLVIQINKQVSGMSLFNFFKKDQQQKQREKPKPSFYQQEQLKLPQNFAQTVMDLQMRMQFVQSCDLGVITQLNQLYRIAVEYYATVDAKKAEHFHRKLTSLLTNPNTMDVIEKKGSGKPVQVGGYEKNLKQELNKFNSQSNVVVRSMIEGNQRKIQAHNRLINQHIQSQTDRLQRRLEERSRSKSKKGTAKK